METIEIQERVGNAQRKFIQAQSECVSVIMDMLEEITDKEIYFFDLNGRIAENHFIPIIERTPFKFSAIFKLRSVDGLLEVFTCDLTKKGHKPITKSIECATIIPDIERGLQDFENADWWFILDIVHEKWEEELDEKARQKIIRIFGQ